jgi:hypothetical protein
MLITILMLDGLSRTVVGEARFSLMLVAGKMRRSVRSAREQLPSLKPCRYAVHSGLPCFRH